MLAFSTGDYDITFPSDVSVPLMKDVKARAPNAICEMTTTGVLINLMVNRVNPPFDNPEIRKAMSLALDRKAFNTILMEGLARMGGAMLPKDEGEWGMPPEMVNALTGYGPDTARNLAEAQAIMQKLGYSDAKPLAIKIQTRNLPTYRDPAVILTDQLKKIYITAELDILDTPRWYSRLQRKDYTIGLNLTGVSVDDPTANRRKLFLQFGAQLHAILQCRSRQAARCAVARARPREAHEDGLGCRAHAGRGRRGPVILHSSAANCWQPHVKNFKPHSNSQYNNLRFEDVWLDK